MADDSDPPNDPREWTSAVAEPLGIQRSSLDAYLSEQGHIAGRPVDADGDSEYAASSVSTWTNFLRHYSITAKPDCCIKLRKRVTSLTLGADALIPWHHRHPMISLIVKPHGALGGWVKRVTLTPEDGELLVETPKFRVSFLRLQFLAQFSRDYGVQLNYRATTKFGSTGRRTIYKKQFQLCNSFGVRPHARVDMYFPEVTGCFGSGGGNRTVEQGHCHVSIPRLNFRWDLDGQLPPRRLLAWMRPPRRWPFTPGSSGAPAADDQSSDSLSEEKSANSLLVCNTVP